MMPMLKPRTPEEEDQLIRDFLMPKAPPIPPSSFDVNESTSPNALAGNMDVPAIDDFMDFKLDMGDLPQNQPDPFAIAPESPVAPVSPAPAITPLPAPKAPSGDPVPASVAALENPLPAAPTDGPTDRENMMKKLDDGEWIRTIGKAFAGLGDAGLARRGQKGNFLSNAITTEEGSRDRKVKEYDAATKIKKEDAEAKAKNDPNSPRSKAYQDLMVEYFPGKDFSKLSAAQIEEVIGPVGKMAEARETRKAREDARLAQRDSLKAERDRRYDERRVKDKERVLEKYNSDPGVRKIDASIDAANTIRGLVDSNNPIAASAVPTFMARASGEVGNLSEADKRPFGGSQALMSRLEAALTQKATGRLTKDNAIFIKQLADTMEKRAMSNKDRRARELSLQYASANDYLDPNDLYDTLRPGVGGKPAPKADGKVTVSNGTETLRIDPSDVADAEREGFKVVR